MVSTTCESHNLQLLWRRAVREGRDIGYERGQSEGYKAGYEAGYRDCGERGADDNWEQWEEFEWSLQLGVTPQPKDEPKSTTVDATSQTEPQFNHSTNKNTQTDPQPPPLPRNISPTTVDASPSLSMTENTPGTSTATSSVPTALELENHPAFEAATPPVLSPTELTLPDLFSAMSNVMPTAHNPPHLENATFSSSSVQTTSTVDYEAPASLEVLENVCSRASLAASNMPLGAVWSRAKKSGFDEGSRMVDGLLVTDLVKAGFEKGNLHGIMAERDHHSQTCPGLIPRSTCEAGIQVVDADPLNSPEAIDILCAFSSTAPSTTPFGLIWERVFQAGTEVAQAQTPHLVNVSTQTVIPTTSSKRDS